MTTIKLRRGTSAEWTASNPVLADGEPGFEKDTGQYKLGNGVSTWSQLPYFQSVDKLSATFVRPIQGAATGYPARGAGTASVRFQGPTIPTDATVGDTFLDTSGAGNGA